jgi:L-malate glycosyltransferase
VTTLHGTDITLTGNDPSYSQIVAFSIGQSDGVTAVSESLRVATRQELGIEREIAVIPNFLDCTVHRRLPAADLRRRFDAADDETRIVIHVSNFRPVKRVSAVVHIFERIQRRVPARLLLVGDGPELSTAHRTAHELGISGLVHSAGAQQEVLPLLSIADVFLLPSAQESFGLAALEAMACEVPVVASNVGGLPEVIEHGVTGFLHDPDDLDAMAASAIAVLTDPDRHRAIADAAACRVRELFCEERVVPMYVSLYSDVLTRQAPATSSHAG